MPDDGDDVVYHEPRSRILLLNFSAETESALRAKSHHVRRCTVTSQPSHGTFYVSPVPPHSVDVLIARAGRPLQESPSAAIEFPEGQYVGMDAFYYRVLEQQGICVFLLGAPPHLTLARLDITLNPSERLRPGMSAQDR